MKITIKNNSLKQVPRCSRCLFSSRKDVFIIKPEETIEVYFKNQSEKAGFLCYKFAPSGRNGVPDRILIGHGTVLFVEIKRPKAKPRPEQVVQIRKINEKGVVATYVSTKEEVDKLLAPFKEGAKK